MTKQVVMAEIEFTNTKPGYKNRDGSFVIIPKKMPQDPNLSDAEFRILTYLHDKAGNPDPTRYSAKNRACCRIAFPLMETIGEETNRSARQAQDAITSLSLKGYLKITHVKVPKGIKNVYRLNFPSWYQALEGVDTFTQYVATGKTLVKRDQVENLPTPELEIIDLEEGTEEILSTPTEEILTTPTEENLLVNSSKKNSSIETGTSTGLRPEEVQEVTREDQGSPLVETKSSLVEELVIPGLVDSVPGEVVKEVQKEKEVSPLVDAVDANASPSGLPKKRSYSFTPKKRIDRVPAPTGLDVVDAYLSDVDTSEAETVQEIPEKPQRPLYVAPERKPWEDENRHENRKASSWKSYIQYTIPAYDEEVARWQRQYGQTSSSPLSPEGQAKLEGYKAMQVAAHAY
ncbi:hypothetical protein ACFWFF_39565 [Streptomyces sp. NPDC060223]|uniref:hypothetical protein n=1 Tax=unclassified Streptomyces TaxID=2593676 RepID=UPI00362FAE43